MYETRKIKLAETCKLSAVKILEKTKQTLVIKRESYTELHDQTELNLRIRNLLENNCSGEQQISRFSGLWTIYYHGENPLMDPPHLTC